MSRKRKVYFTKEWLSKQIEGDNTIKSITEKAGVSERTIYDYMKKFKINSKALRKKGKLFKAKQQALTLDLVLLSKEYKGSHIKHWYKHTVCGEVFESTPKYVKAGDGCKKCGHVATGLKHRLSPARYNKFISDINGVVKYTKYTDKGLHLTIKCNQCGNVWNTSWQYLLLGRRCPTCFDTVYFHEESFRRKLEEITGEKFPTIRPNWLRNPKTNYNLELDGFNNKLKIGFEYQGEQHFKRVKFFHKTHAQFRALKKRDLLKKKLCKKHRVRVMYPNYLLKEGEYEAFIKSFLRG